MNRAEFEQRLRERIRLQGKSRKTANTYWHWIRRYLDFNRSRGTGRETRAERAVEAFLSHLANREHVAIQVCVDTIALFFHIKKGLAS